MSVITSEDDIIGIALIEAYPQKVNVDEISESSRNSDVVVSSLQEGASFPAIAVQTISNVSEQDEGVIEQRSCLSLKSFWQLAKQDKKGFFVDRELLYHRETLWGQRFKQLCLPDQ